MRQWPGPLILLVTVLLGVGVLVLFPAYSLVETSARQADQLATWVAATPAIEPKDRAGLAKDLLQYRTDTQVKVWTGLMQAATALAAGAAGLIAWRNLRETQKKLDVDREGQVTNRFTQAITQLGAVLSDGRPNVEVRLGGIYALERIATDSPRDHGTIMEVLTAYVRENAPWPPPPVLVAAPEPPPVRSFLGARWVPRRTRDAPAATPAVADASEPPATPTLKPRTDVQAILTVLGRREAPAQSPKPGSLDLSRTDLRGANFREAHLEGGDFREAHLEGAHLWDAHLERAFFRRAHLERAFFRNAHLEGADLWGAHLERANLWDAHLAGVNLWGAHLERANLKGAHLERANFQDAHLERANLWGARLERAGELTPEQVLSTLDHGRFIAELPREWTPEDRATVQRRWEETAPATTEPAGGAR